MAHDNRVITILNPAPAASIDKHIFPLIDYFTPNETEAIFYVYHKVEDESDAQKASDQFLEWGIKNIIITMGEKGAYFANKEEQFHVPIINLQNPVSASPFTDLEPSDIETFLLRNKRNFGKSITSDTSACDNVSDLDDQNDYEC